jgi:hypothetical protein
MKELEVEEGLVLKIHLLKLMHMIQQKEQKNQPQMEVGITQHQDLVAVELPVKSLLKLVGHKEQLEGGEVEIHLEANRHQMGRHLRKIMRRQRRMTITMMRTKKILKIMRTNYNSH